MSVNKLHDISWTIWLVTIILTAFMLFTDRVDGYWIYLVIPLAWCGGVAFTIPVLLDYLRRKGLLTLESEE